MMKLRCVVEHITYQNQENGYSVMRVKVKDYVDLVTLVGNLLDVPVGAVLLCDGVWKMDKRYGRQFVCETWEEVMPATVYGIEKYLGSGLVKGIGPKFAHLIVERFGTETIDIIEEDIERLYEVPGIGKKRVERHHRLRAGTCHSSYPYLPPGSKQPYRDECPCHQPGALS